MNELTAADLASYVSSGRPSAQDAGYIQMCLDDAKDIIASYMERFRVSDDVPETTVRRAILTVGVNLYNQRQSPNGVAQFPDATGAYIQVTKDPLTGVRPLLDSYRMTWGFA